MKSRSHDRETIFGIFVSLETNFCKLPFLLGRLFRIGRQPLMLNVKENNVEKVDKPKKIQEVRLNKSDYDLSCIDKVPFKKSLSFEGLANKNLNVKTTQDDIWKLMLQKESRYIDNNILKDNNQIKINYKMKITNKEIFINGNETRKFDSLVTAIP